MNFYIEKKIRLPKYIGIIPATNPFLKSKTMKVAYKKLLSNKKFNSILSFTNSPVHPLLVIKNRKKIIFDVIRYEGFYDSDFERSQDLPSALIRSAALKFTKTSYFLKFVENTSPFINKHALGLGPGPNKPKIFILNPS